MVFSEHQNEDYMKMMALHIEDYMLPCMTKQIIGMDCPGCGLQRSVVHLAKGEFLDAFNMYPAIYPLTALILFTLASQFYTFKYDFQLKITLAILAAVVIISNYALKITNLIN